MINCEHKGQPNKDGTIFEIILCDQCGGHGSHIACDPVSNKFENKLLSIFKKIHFAGNFSTTWCRGRQNLIGSTFFQSDQVFVNLRSDLSILQRIFLLLINSARTIRLAVVRPRWSDGDQIHRYNL
jgi:hypothetical protein